MTTTTEAPAAEVQPTVAPAQFSVAHRALTDALGIVALAVPKATNIPAQYGVIADAQGSTVTLSAFDFETAVTVRVDAEPGGTGRSLLSHAELKQVLAAAVAGETTAVAARTPVSVAGDVLSTPDLSVPLNMLELAEYPALPPAAPPMVTVDGTEFFRQLARVLPAAGSDYTLPTMSCVRVEIKGGALRMTATDRYRIAVAEVPADGWDGGEPDATALVPADLLTLVAKRLGKYTGPVSVGVHAPHGGTLATFAIGAVEVTVRGREGDFPRVENIMPTEARPVTVQADRAAMAKAVRKATALAKAKGDGKSVAVRIEFGPDGRMSVAPKVDDEVQAKVRGVAVASTTDGEAPCEALGFNGAYLLDALGSFAGDMITLHIEQGRKPLLLTDGPGIAGEGYRHLLMPLFDRS